VLTAFGVFWGVLMLVVMLGFGRGLERGAVDNFGAWAMNSVFVWNEVTSKAHAGRGPGRPVRLTLEDAEAVAAQVPGVERVLPRNFMGGRFGGNRVVRKDKAESFGVSGEVPEFPLLENVSLERGRFLNPLDLAEARKVAVIGARVRDVLFGPDEEPIGAAIRVNGVEMAVVGVYRSPMTGGRADWANGRIFVPRTTFARIHGTGVHVDGLAVLVAPDHDAASVEQAVKAFLKRRHHVHPDDPRGLGSFNRAKEFGKVQALFVGIAALTWVTGVLTLLAGAIGVSNIMMIAVAERTKEIGIRKAIGATPVEIMGQIVTEATVLTALAGYLGLAAGVGVVEGAAALFDRMPPGSGPSFFGRPELDLGKALVATTILTLAGALAGLAPARSAVSIRPVEALAHE
jgi:putative ABC transport system permease protein